MSDSNKVVQIRSVFYLNIDRVKLVAGFVRNRRPMLNGRIALLDLPIGIILLLLVFISTSLGI